MADRAGDRAGAELGPDGSGREPDDRGFWRELPVLIVVALAVAILIKTFLVQAFFIPSISMRPTLEPGDRVLVCRVCVRLGEVQRGDVIVFADPDAQPSNDGFVRDTLRWLAEGIGVAHPQDEDFIKRVVGLPGDVVEIRRGRVFVNGERLQEPYLAGREDTRSFPPRQIPDGMLFVMGDNRLRSGDSRFPPPAGVGLVPVDHVIGIAFVRIWPPGRWGGI
ncbi:MAG: hypothetical protein KatS3mg013_0219 [Actinomycetota bacterium]|nr:MAG: hypothetical protein KatS3mg013_0219 [Actinomycetota bacterium]